MPRSACCRASIGIKGGTLTLTIASRHRALLAEAVERRLGHLGAAMGRETAVAFS